MLRALNEFMGRSTVDPGVRQSFQEGAIEDILLECGFTAEWADKLTRLSTQNFELYLKRVHQTITNELTAEASPDHPWPSEGLSSKLASGNVVDKDEAA